MSYLRTLYDKFILDKIFSSVGELHFDLAILYDQGLQSEESSTDIITQCVQWKVHSQASHLCLCVRMSLVLTLVLLADEVIRLLGHFLHHRAADLRVVFQQLMAGQVFDNACPDGVSKNIGDSAEAIPKVRQRRIKGTGCENSGTNQA